MFTARYYTQVWRLSVDIAQQYVIFKPATGLCMSIRKIIVATLFSTASVIAPVAVSAPILLEYGSNFSNDWTAPTVVDSGTSDVSGAGAPEWTGGDRLDIFRFSGLVPGATSIAFNFMLTGPLNTGAYTNGGGAIYFSYQPFSGSYYVDKGDGTVLGSQQLLAGYFEVIYNPWETANALNRGESGFVLNLSDDFTGELYLALDFTHGGVSYNFNTPAWAALSLEGTTTGAAASPVPLPAPGWLFLTGILSLFVYRRLWIK